MAEKKPLWIIGDRDQMPENLRQALTELNVPTEFCSSKQIEKSLPKASKSVAVIPGSTWNNLNEDCLDSIRRQIQELTLEVLLVLDTKPQEDKSFRRGLYHAQPHESAEMIKGRLATLLEWQSQLHGGENELERLRMIRQPLTNHFSEMDEQMRLAARLQRDFLPKQMPTIPGIQFAGIYRPALWVSGDIYDIMRLDERHVGFYVADVVGHGLPAALLTMFIKRALVTKRISGNSYHLVKPGQVLALLNEEFAGQHLSDFQFATCCYGLLDVQTLELQVASAGHPCPLRVDRQGRMHEIEASGMLLGIFTGQEYQTHSCQLAAGDKLLLYSDGVEVAFTNEPDKPLGFRQEFQHLGGLDIKKMCHKLLVQIEQEEGSLHPRDDVTILGMQIEDPYPPA